MALVGLLLAVLPAAAAGPTPNFLERVADSPVWDDSHSRMTDAFNAAIERIDRLFGDDRLDEDTRDSMLRLRLGLRYSHHDSLSLESGVRLRLVMPQLEQRLQLIVDDFFESDDPGSTSSLRDSVKDSETDAALRFIFGESARHRLSFDAGLRGTSPVQLLARVRGRVVLPVGEWELRLSESIALLSTDGLESVSEMRWSRQLGDDWFFRSTSQLIWEEEKRSGVMPFQSLAVIRALSDRRAFRIEVSGLWPETPHTREALYRTEFTYRQRLHRWWLFIEPGFGLQFPQLRDYDPDPFVFLRFETIFGHRPPDEEPLR